MISLLVPSFFLFLLLVLKSFFFLSESFVIDPISLVMVCIFPLVLLLIWDPFFSFSSLKENSFHCFLFLFVMFFLLLCFITSQSFFFLLFLESCAMLMFLCISILSKDQDKLSSSLFMFFMNIFPSILFMYFCFKWGDSLFFLHFSPSESLSLFCFICFLGILLSKLPLFFFHFWLTKAHVSASGCGSMILASLMLKMGSMGMFKFYFVFLMIYSLFSSLFFCFVSIFSLILLLVMVRFFDLKYLVACSSIVHMGPLSCLVLMGGSPGLLGSCLMQVGHGLVSYFVFFLVTLLYEVSHHRSIDFNKTSSSWSSSLFLCLFFFFLLNMGFPPFCSFISEVLFVYCFLSFDLICALILCLTMIPSGIFFFFVLSKSCFGIKSNTQSSFLSPNLLIFNYLFLVSFIVLPFLIF